MLQIEILLAQELNLSSEKICGFRLVGVHFCNLTCVHERLFSKNHSYLQYCVLKDLLLLIWLFSSYMGIRMSQYIYTPFLLSKYWNTQTASISTYLSFSLKWDRVSPTAVPCSKAYAHSDVAQGIFCTAGSCGIGLFSFCLLTPKADMAWPR